jgi:hypothetical protein
MQQPEGLDRLTDREFRNEVQDRYLFGDRGIAHPSMVLHFAAEFTLVGFRELQGKLPLLVWLVDTSLVIYCYFAFSKVLCFKC